MANSPRFIFSTPLLDSFVRVHKLGKIAFIEQALAANVDRWQLPGSNQMLHIGKLKAEPFGHFLDC
jgi:hypothetical protein